ncbi:4-hydroxy-tetrahydrodipicolinate reductase [Acetobacteraceae bacterium KSS8]|uniref:4-hydroxy-tetrahydrodipicolinate reductase n=2 Tax=Endosaccharibacter trunci TaxID=2812733 RepID=A0ABT1W3I5_9PROT|nr:4-hydroxy-tetrahydrodipicolinate reductase [Acetobacteraceae bacterium KSS8]
MDGLPRIGVAGLSGRVGRLLREEIETAALPFAGGVGRDGDLAELASRSDVVIDFTHADTATRHAAILAEADVNWVLGTTGLSTEAQQAVEHAAVRISIVQASNFSPGVVLMTALARRMAAALPADAYDAEILETHHRQKVDAPSGTALSLGRAVAEARGQRFDAVRDSGRDGHAGGRRPGAIGFAALRGGQIVGEHTLSFTSDAEQLSIEHRAFDRRVFATGALRAALWSHGRQPGLFGMEHVLGLA